MFHFSYSKKSVILPVFSLILTGLFSAVLPALAVDPKPNISHPSMEAKFISQSVTDPITIEVGEELPVVLKFKNIGTEAWPTSGRKSISAYTMEPRDRKSVFVSQNWTSAKQTGPINKATKPGETTDLVIVLKAPQKIGDYTEEFYLASENYSWVKGGYFFLKIKVVPAKVKEEIKENTTDTETAPKVTFSANKFMQSPKAVEAAGGERIKLILGFQNTGDKPWTKYALAAGKPLSLASDSQSLSFADEAWQDSSVIMQKNGEVAPGGFVREEIYFRAPAKEGEYTAKFYLQVEGETLSDVYAEVPVTVTSDAPSHYTEPFGNSNTNNTPVSYRLEKEPTIRVGLWQPPSYVQFRSEEDDYNVFAGAQNMGILPRGKLAILMRKDDQYYFRGGDLEFSSNDYLRLEPINNFHSVFTILNYSRYVTWKGPNNFNEYRGGMEYRLGEVKTDAVWVVNDILMEDYMKGIGENGNTSPTEYLKAQSVAQRSYAYATILNDKYGIFDVVATTGDQLYLGVENERIMPNFVSAVIDTRGQMVVYDNKVVITPYYGHAVCRTLSWTEKWGGAVKPWLVSVKTSYDCQNYSRMLGHGVGMSQMDASRRAKAEGLDFVSLVKYYYTGVEVERVYE